jgi:GNAT superfamily N-acetyltransferase
MATAAWPDILMRREIRSSDSLSHRERRQLSRWLKQFVDLDSSPIVWAVADWFHLTWERERLLCHLEIIERRATVSEEPVLLGGLGGLVTQPEYRGKGLATATLRESVRFMTGELQVGYGLLLCEERLEPFYRRLGWESVSGPLFFDQPAGRVQWARSVMVLPLRGKPWPEGEIDLRGLPW